MCVVSVENVTFCVTGICVNLCMCERDIRQKWKKIERNDLEGMRLVGCVNTLTFSDTRGTFIPYGWVSLSLYCIYHFISPNTSFPPLHQLKLTAQFLFCPVIQRSILIFLALACLSSLNVFAVFLYVTQRCVKMHKYLSFSASQGAIFKQTNFLVVFPVASLSHSSYN